MNAVLAETTTALAYETENILPVYVFIAYDDEAAYRRALRVLVNVAEQLGDDLIEMRPLPWRFADLANPSLRRLAAEDIARAPILVLTTSADGALSEGIEEWLPKCMEQRRHSGAAVVSLLGAPDSLNSTQLNGNQFVRKTAKMAGWDFIEPSQTLFDGGAVSHS